MPVLLGSMSTPSQDFPLFKEGQQWGVMEVTGVVVCLASFRNLVLFTCWGAGSRSPGVLAPSSRRVAYSHGVGEGPGSSSTGHNREATRTSSLSMVANRAMHCWSSLAAQNRTPGLAPDASAHACSALAGFLADGQKFHGSKTGDESPVGKALVGQVGCPIIRRLPVLQVVA